MYRSLERAGVRFSTKQDNRSLLLTQVLLDVGADPRDSPLLMYDVVSAGNPSVLKLLLSDGRAMIDGILDEAISTENTEMVSILLANKRVDPSIYSNSALMVAVDRGDISVVQMLLTDPRVNPSDRENSTVVRCCQRGYADILRVLLADKRVTDQYSLDDYANDDLYLEISVEHSHTEVVELLMDTLSPSLEAVERVLKVAARRSRLDTCESLVKYLIEEDRPIPEEAIAAARTRRRTDLLYLFDQVSHRRG